MKVSPIFAVQYLESRYPDATPTTVRRRLRQVFERLPISLVLLGWDLPVFLEEVVAEETTRQHAKLFRWQPILTGDAHTDLPPEWVTLGPGGDPIPGHDGMPEFTFICPNRNAVADFLSERVENATASGLYQGLFLDRIRFPSPGIDPMRFLACFCTHCSHLAAEVGLDLEAVRQNIRSLPPSAIANSLLGHPTESGSLLESFLDFRASSISRTVRMVTQQAETLNLSVGLDCFSPVLTRMVGQDLSTLDGYSDWVKIMTYPRVFGPAGIPFELLNLAEWLIHQGQCDTEVMQLLSDASNLHLSESKDKLALSGLGSETIAMEIQHGYELGVTNLLAGIAMVNLENVHKSSPEQIKSDLEVSRNAGGIVISWDLWLTPLIYLDSIRTMWN
jgi:hypothetical protein